jgi:hypothetical protein
MIGDDYGDLADAVLRGAIVGGEPLGADRLRARYTIRLASWERMLRGLLEQLGRDAGSTREALTLLGTPASLVGPWLRDPIIGTEASACWLASQQRDADPRVALTASVRALRGDDYGDLARAAGTMATAGDGALDPARLRSRYTLDRGPWLRMVADLLGQVVADAGSVERASTVLAVPLARLAEWVRRMVSRGCPHAAGSRWPTAPVTDTPEAVAYLDLVEAVERGAIDGDNAIGPIGVSEFYTVRLDSWERMEADLLEQVIADAGSVRKAAKVLGVPRATLGAWTRRAVKP